MILDFLLSTRLVISAQIFLHEFVASTDPVSESRFLIGQHIMDNFFKLIGHVTRLIPLIDLYCFNFDTFLSSRMGVKPLAS